MPLQFELRHLTFDTWHHKRPSGKGSVAVGDEFCILYTTDTGAADKEAILTSDAGTLTECAQLTTTDN